MQVVGKGKLTNNGVKDMSLGVTYEHIIDL